MTKKLLTICLILVTALQDVAQATYYVGVGRADCTGPSAEITFMGYAKSAQKGCGIHLRQFSRAYVFNDTKTIMAFVTIDACMMNHPVKQAVIDKLAIKYPNVYTLKNTILSGTHSHSTPGGFLKDVMLDIPNFGYVKETFDALVDGIVRSIIRAHNNQKKAKIFVNSGELLNTNRNRSPASYLYNPQEEQKKYKDDVDKEMVQLKIVGEDNKPIGAINWFAVHPTSMNNTNCLVHSDNVGYASILLESAVNVNSLPGTGAFVGAFASTNLGDTSPNLKDPICINTNEPCDFEHSTCNGENKYCIAFGPGKDMFESTQIIATNLFNKGKELLEASNGVPIEGDLKYIHRFSHMPSQTATIQLENSTKVEVRGCLPAMGYGFAAGTTDGPGEFNFEQATNTSNFFWNLVRDFVFPPSPDDVACHAPKPILIMSGKINLPYEWAPQTVATQILQIGQFYLVAVPGEFTTMSGRRLREAVDKEITAASGSKPAKVVLAGLSNVYTNYIATPEEYTLQRYEGASTIFGPHTLTIYLKLYKELANALIKGKTLKDDSKPFEFPDDMLSLVPPVLFDASGWFNNYGDCIVQPANSYRIGQTAKAVFIAGHPRNNNMQEATFLTIEKEENDGKWTAVANDANWETKFIWSRMVDFKPTSQAEIQWEITDKFEPGTYRIVHSGYYKYILGGTYPYTGTSKSFTVTK